MEDDNGKKFCMASLLIRIKKNLIMALTKHDKKVKQIAKDLQKKGWTVKADISGFTTPDKIGQNNYIPDITATKSGANKIIEVETPTSVKRDKKQQETFRRSAAQKTRTTFKIVVAK